MILALTGFMGCGKSTVARILGSGSDWKVWDLDDVITSGEGCGIPQIFKREQGAEGFRRLEAEYLARILRSCRQVTDESPDGRVKCLISLGGGTVMNPVCTQMLKDDVTVIYLKAGVDTIVGNLHIVGYSRRPLLQDCTGDEDLRTRVTTLLAEREEVYERTADIVMDIDGLSPEEIAIGVKVCLDKIK